MLWLFKTDNKIVTLFDMVEHKQFNVEVFCTNSLLQREKSTSGGI